MLPLQVSVSRVVGHPTYVKCHLADLFCSIEAAATKLRVIVGKLGIVKKVFGPYF